MFRVSDFCIGDYPVTENFGDNPAIYSARYNLQGYPGLRVKMPSLTPILAVAPGFVFEIGFEEGGKGKFITLVHDGFLTTYGHLNDILVLKDEKVISGQLIAHSNQSGLAEEPCLYFGIAPCDPAGTKTEQNGFDGYVDPLDSNRVQWDIKSPTQPVTKADTQDKITIQTNEYSALVAQATNYKIILAMLQDQTSLDEFLQEEGQSPINIATNPQDSSAGNKITSYLATVSDGFDVLEKEIEELKKTDPQAQVLEEPLPLVKKNSFFVRLKHELGRFIFKS